MDGDSARLFFNSRFQIVGAQRFGSQFKTGTLLTRKSSDFVGTVWQQSLESMAAPYLGMRIETTKKNQLGSPPTTYQNHSCPLLDDLKKEPWNFGVRKGLTAIKMKRSQGPVIVEEKNPGRHRPKALDEGLLVRFSGDTIAVAPPFICSESDIVAMVEGLRRALRAAPTS